MVRCLHTVCGKTGPKARAGGWTRPWSLSRRVIQDLDSAECFILDAQRMLWLDAVAGELLGRLAERLRRANAEIRALSQ